MFTTLNQKKKHAQTYHVSYAWMFTTLDKKTPCTNISCQLGWGVNSFGPKKTHVQIYHVSLFHVSMTEVFITLGQKPHVQTYHVS